MKHLTGDDSFGEFLGIFPVTRSEKIGVEGDSSSLPCASTLCPAAPSLQTEELVAKCLMPRNCCREFAEERFKVVFPLSSVFKKIKHLGLFYSLFVEELNVPGLV